MFTRLLGNLSLGMKLSLGFALVMASTLGVAATALYALNVLEARGEKIRQSGSIQTLLLQARVAEKEFGLALTSESAIRVALVVNELVTLLRAQDPGDIRSARAVDVYLEQFERYAQAQRTARQARVHMQERAQAVG